MRLTALLASLLCLGSVAHAQPSAGLVPLFDFETGIDGWSGNPWGGGKCAPGLATEAQFGKGALRATYTEIKQGGNVICPYFPAEAPWRTGDYDRLCLWLKGDGSDAYLNLQVETGDREQPNLYTARIPLDSKRWRRVSLKFSTFWNRQGTPFDLATMQRFYFGLTGTHEVLIDQIALQRPVRQIPLQALDNAGPAAMTPELYANREGVHFLTFDPHAILEPTVSAEVTITWPTKKANRLQKTLAAQSATEEVWIPLPGRPDSEGEASLLLKLAEQSGNLCYAGKFSFPVALEAYRLADTQLQLLPTPKSLVYHPGKFVLPRTLQAHVLSQPDLAMLAVKRLQQDLQGFGRQVLYKPEKLTKTDTAFVVITPANEEPTIPQEVLEKLQTLRAQGYILHVDGERIVLAARDAAGMRFAAITLAQALRTASPSAQEAHLPQLTIIDWPTCQWRAISIGLPTTRWGHPNDAPIPVDYFIDYLRRMVVEQKFNTVSLEVLQGMKYDRHPEIAGPAAYTKDEVRKIVQFLRGNGVEVFPQVEALGHANWLVIPHPELREDGDEHTLCTRHPLARQILADCFEECLEVFQPRYFHFGLDEIRWVTGTVAPEKRCPRCQGVDKRALFVDQVNWLHGWAATSGVQMLMWADMVLRDHNGGPPFNLSDTLDKLPRDIIMCDWSTSLSPLSLADLHRRGFPVLKSNSAGVNNAQAQDVLGNMWGVWAKTPWLTESLWNIRSYCYLSNMVAAEYGWNAYPDLLADDIPVLPEFFAERPLAQKRLAMQPEPQSGAVITPLNPGTETVPVAGLKFQPFTQPLTETATVEVGRPVSALYLLLAADLPQSEWVKFLDEFKRGSNWRGVVIGELELKYADGTTEIMPLRYATHVRATSLDEPFPQVLEALGTAAVGARMGYVVQWVNLHPERPVTSVKLTPGTLAARPLLLGLSAREVWEGK